METIRLTMAQAVVKWPIAQKTVIDGETVPLVPGVFAVGVPEVTERELVRIAGGQYEVERKHQRAGV